MDSILCKCGCGQARERLDAKGRNRFYINGHQNRVKSLKQIETATIAFNKHRLKIPWNKGKTYIHKSKKVYANKGAWNQALRRIFPASCMRCGWDLASCDTHHIIPKKKGGQFTIENGIVLCPNCHRLADLNILSQEDLRAIKNAFLIKTAVP